MLSFAAYAFALMAIFVAILFGMAVERERMRREIARREAELAGLKASYTDPKREIVV